MRVNSIFYPMSEYPIPDDSDSSFSMTVIIYGEKNHTVELGYFDFETKKWAHFGKMPFLLKCWCYIPDARTYLSENDWTLVQPTGFKKIFY